MPNIVSIMLLMILLISVNSQGGGGGGSSSSGGGSSGGMDSYDEGSDSISCEEECEDSDNEDCVSECEDQRSLTLAIVLPLVLGLPIIIGLTVFLVIRYKKHSKEQNERDRLRNQQYIETENVSITEDSIKMMTAGFMKARWNFDFQQQRRNYKIDSFTWNFKSIKQPGKQEFVGSGKDSFGSWTCEGYLQFPQNDTIKLWMLKDYLDKVKAGQTGAWKHLIFTGHYNERRKQFSGDWYYENFVDDDKYSGIWQLTMERNDQG